MFSEVSAQMLLMPFSGKAQADEEISISATWMMHSKCHFINIRPIDFINVNGMQCPSPKWKVNLILSVPYLFLESYLPSVPFLNTSACTLFKLTWKFKHNPANPTQSTEILMMAWWHQEPGHHQTLCWPSLTHWGRDKMDAISQTTFSSAFSWKKIFEFRLKFHWSLFLRVQLTLFQHWFRLWLGAVQATSHYLNQWWLIYRRIYASLGLNELTRTLGCHKARGFRGLTQIGLSFNISHFDGSFFHPSCHWPLIWHN